LNNQLGEKKRLFKKQNDEIKALQAKLQTALREKTNTKKAYTRVHSAVFLQLIFFEYLVFNEF
jgi:hypothetical protein